MNAAPRSFAPRRHRARAIYREEMQEHAEAILVILRDRPDAVGHCPQDDGNGSSCLGAARVRLAGIGVRTDIDGLDPRQLCPTCRVFWCAFMIGADLHEVGERGE